MAAHSSVSCAQDFNEGGAPLEQEPMHASGHACKQELDRIKAAKPDERCDSISNMCTMGFVIRSSLTNARAVACAADCTRPQQAARAMRMSKSCLQLPC